LGGGWSKKDLDKKAGGLYTYIQVSVVLRYVCFTFPKPINPNHTTQYLSLLLFPSPRRDGVTKKAFCCVERRWWIASKLVVQARHTMGFLTNQRG
jgi:hypothetical protein